MGYDSWSYRYNALDDLYGANRRTDDLYGLSGLKWREPEPWRYAPPPVVLRDISFQYVGLMDRMSGTLSGPIAGTGIHYDGIGQIRDGWGTPMYSVGPCGMLQPPIELPPMPSYFTGTCW
jgi:hypothetical protein